MSLDKWQFICNLIILIGGAMVVLGTFGHYYFGRLISKSGPSTLVPTSTIEGAGAIDASGNNGTIQVNVNSPNSIVNQRRVLDSQYDVTHSTRDGKYITRITLRQTPGIWDASERFHLQVLFSGPYDSSKFVSGLGTLRHFRGPTDKDAASKGIIDYESLETPIDEPIVVEVISSSALDIAKIFYSPTSTAK